MFPIATPKYFHGLIESDEDEMFNHDDLNLQLNSNFISSDFSSNIYDIDIDNDEPNDLFNITNTITGNDEDHPHHPLILNNNANYNNNDIDNCFSHNIDHQQSCHNLNNFGSQYSNNQYISHSHSYSHLQQQLQPQPPQYYNNNNNNSNYNGNISYANSHGHINNILSQPLAALTIEPPSVPVPVPIKVEQHLAPAIPLIAHSLPSLQTNFSPIPLQPIHANSQYNNNISNNSPHYNASTGLNQFDDEYKHYTDAETPWYSNYFIEPPSPNYNNTYGHHINFNHPNTPIYNDINTDPVSNTIPVYTQPLIAHTLPKTENVRNNNNKNIKKRTRRKRGRPRKKVSNDIAASADIQPPSKKRRKNRLNKVIKKMSKISLKTNVSRPLGPDINKYVQMNLSKADEKIAFRQINNKLTELDDGVHCLYDNCNKKFTSRCHAQRHVWEKHIGRLYLCLWEGCTHKGSKQRSSLIEHIKIKHFKIKTPFECPCCGECFTRLHGVKRHLWLNRCSNKAQCAIFRNKPKYLIKKKNKF